MLLQCVGVLLVLAAVACTQVDSRLVAMVRNMTDPSCVARRIPCSTLASVDTHTGEMRPYPTTIWSLQFVQGLQVATTTGQYLVPAGPAPPA